MGRDRAEIDDRVQAICGVMVRDVGGPFPEERTDPFAGDVRSGCQAGGFIWASDIPTDSWVQYQIVKTFDDDTLMRHLRFSPNHQEAVHKPIDDVELPARGLPLKRKKKKFL